MGRDLPDGTRKMVLEFSGGLVGLEELAARLGSIVPFDMQGNVFFQDDFEGSLVNWTELTSGGAEASSIVATLYRSPTHSLVLAVPNVAGNYVTRHTYLPYLGAKKYGFACALTIPLTADDARFLVTFKVNLTLYYAGVAIDHVNKLVKIRTGAAAYTSVASLTQATNIEPVFHTLQLYVNMVTKKYIKLKLDDTEVDLSTYSLATGTEANAEDYIQLLLGNYADAAVGSGIYFEDIVAVRNVP